MTFTPLQANTSTPYPQQRPPPQHACLDFKGESLEKVIQYYNTLHKVFTSLFPHLSHATALINGNFLETDNVIRHIMYASFSVP